jgi:hypothetical protein
MQNQNRPMFAPGFDNNGTIGQEGTPFPKAAAGDQHALINTSRKKVQGNGLDDQGAMWQRLVDQGFSVRPAQPTKITRIEIFGKKDHRGQVQDNQGLMSP